MNHFHSKAMALAAVLTVFAASLQAQQLTQVLFQDDFSSNSIDPAKYTPDSPFFEGGVGDIGAQAGDGVMRFVGTTTQQWWSGGTLQIAGVYAATEATPVTISIDRVAEAGVGSASRSALWILDETKTHYVLFADVRGEGGWRYNRKIGEDGDVPTGSGTDIGPFNGGNYDDGALHRMSIVADGATAKLYLDGVLGAEVKFPFNKVVFQFGAYARANDDTADTTWDNLRIETSPAMAVVFSDDFSGSAVDPAKFQPDSPFFEGGVGTIQGQISDGTLRFTGETTQQWWSGGTLRVVPTFTATEAAPVVVTVDRVAELGVGSASRSALWILDETQTQYVLFADVRGEGGWRYNRKIGEDGDVPTGSGTDIGAFNGGDFDDGGLHRMGVIADGRTVKLYLDGILGAEVKFPFSKIVVHLGAYARANGDTADTTWDNLKIETVATAAVPPLFEDDFSSNTIDPAKYVPDSPFFEGGVGTIEAVAGDGVIRFVGETTQQWWSGGTLRIVPTFAPSETETVTLSIDRVAEAGVGSASRSALWIMDASMTYYVLFADVRGEGGWRFNRKIGEDGDVPTGSGTDIAAYNGEQFDDGGLHRMKMVADGQTVRLFLDDIPGPTVRFPFSPVIFQFGAFARANGDTADTTWDNLLIESTGSATFGQSEVGVRVGTASPEITVRIPQGLNSQRAVQVQVVSSDPAIAVPEGGTGGTLSLTFPAGGANTRTFRIRGTAVGGAQFSLQGDIAGGNRLSVAVLSGPGVALEDNFNGPALDPARWQVSNRGFEAGTGTYTVTQSAGALYIDGTAETDFWSGASVKSVGTFTATRDLNLVVEADRVSLDYFGTAARSGIFLTTGDRSRYLFFGHNIGENGWQVNQGDTGGGVNLAVFDDLDFDGGNHRMKLVADGRTVEVFLNGVSGGRFALEATTGLHVELGVYARAEGDTVTGVFDNLQVGYVLPCTDLSPGAVSMTLGDSGRQGVVTVPQLLNDQAPVTVTITSRNPAVAVPAGATGGSLTLNFPAGAPNRQSFGITPVGKGATVFDIVTSPASCVTGSLSVDVVALPLVLLSDDFSGSEVDTTKWRQDETPFDFGTFDATASAVTVSGGAARITVTVESSLWPGLALYTVATYDAAVTTPVTFEIDRVSVGFDLVTGTGAEQRTGAWIRDAVGNFVFFSDYLAHDGRNFGWRYNKVTGGADDDATGAGVNIAAFDGGQFDNRGNHRMKLVANGASVKLYLNDLFGAEVPFPFSTGLSFGFGAYADETGNVVRGVFDNARVLGGEDTSAPPQVTATLQGENVVITWTGEGVLEETDALGTPTAWRPVTPAPPGNTYTVVPLDGFRGYRVVR
ncbi:MAG: hypothetical protein KF791_07085 [Verrucomicrobiae bacterium]|nr:hypothetical protein [Verrucomicrobiae bacterium]